MKPKVKRIMIAFAAVVALWVAVFLGARYGWRLAGFSACRTVRIESVSVETDCVKIEGSWPGHWSQWCGKPEISMKMEEVYDYNLCLCS